MKFDVAIEERKSKKGGRKERKKERKKERRDEKARIDPAAKPVFLN